MSCNRCKKQVNLIFNEFPDEPEPVYYGMKLAIMTTHADVFYRFRKMAVAKNIPRTVLALLDFGFEMMSGKKYEAHACLDEIKIVFGPHHYFVTLLEYVARDIFSDDEKKARQAKKALIDSIDQYCLTLLKVEDT